MDLIFLFAGVVLGAFIGFLIGRVLPGKQKGNEESHVLNAQLDREQAEVNRLRVELQEIQETVTELSAEGRKGQAEISFLKERLAKEKTDQEAASKLLTKEFENVASRILRQNSEEIGKLSGLRLDQTMKPLEAKIKEFSEKIDTNAKERSGLRGELQQMFELNQRMSAEALNLTKALKGESKKQGNWGEIILERVLEDSGLQRGREYEVEQSTSNAEGKSIRPDVIVHLPENKHVIVDAKVSLKAYEQHINAEDEEVRQVAAKQHVDSMKSHIKTLGDKAYQTSVNHTSPDFVLMFVPIEAAFSVAMQTDPEIYALAWGRKIVIVSPTTLLATLRTVASIWKQEKQNQNAMEIAEVGGSMYDKFANFVKDMEEISRHLDKASEAHEGAMNKLTSGRGNLLTRAEKMQDLGAKASKKIKIKGRELSSKDEKKDDHQQDDAINN